jgi:hypothetical protein
LNHHQVNPNKSESLELELELQEPKSVEKNRGPHRSRRQPTPLPGLRCGTRLARRASPPRRPTPVVCSKKERKNAMKGRFRYYQWHLDVRIHTALGGLACSATENGATGGGFSVLVPGATARPERRTRTGTGAMRDTLLSPCSAAESCSNPSLSASPLIVCWHVWSRGAKRVPKRFFHWKRQAPSRSM